MRKRKASIKAPRKRKAPIKKLLHGRQIIKQKVNVKVSTMGAAPVGGTPAAIQYPQYVSSYQSTPAAPVVNAGGSSVGQAVGGRMSEAVYDQFLTSVSDVGTQTPAAVKRRPPPVPAPLAGSGQVQVPLSTRSSGDGPDAAPDMENAFFVPPTAADRPPSGIPSRPGRTLSRSPATPLRSPTPPADRPARRQSSFYQAGVPQEYVAAQKAARDIAFARDPNAPSAAQRRQTVVPSYSPGGGGGASAMPPTPAERPVGLAPLA